MNSEIIKNKDYSIFYYGLEKRNKDIIFICFDNINGGLRKKGFGVDFLIKNSIEVIFVSHRQLSFFQGLSESNLYNHIKEHIKDKKVFTYGSSLGAYAALYYAPILNAQAIAFSPVCSIDPIFDKASQYSTKFIHTPLNEKNLKSKVKPIIVIDENNKKDSTFLNNRIIPAYGDELIKVNLPNGTHHTARVMTDLGILKSFVLNIIETGVPPPIKFDFLSSTYCLYHMAFKKALEQKFDLVNLYLKKIIDLKFKLKHRGSPGFDNRLKAYSILIKQGKLKHEFDRGLIINLEKDIIIRQHVQRVKKNTSVDDFLRSQFEMHILLMEYEEASELAKNMCLLYPNIEEYKNLLYESRVYLENSKNWII